MALDQSATCPRVTRGQRKEASNGRPALNYVHDRRHPAGKARDSTGEQEPVATLDYGFVEAPGAAVALAVLAAALLVSTRISTRRVMF